MDAPLSKDKVPVGKDTRSLEKKRRKSDDKQKKHIVSQAKTSKNTFEALGKADNDDDVADEEGDGEQISMNDNFFCP